jgi:hypothetical protein
MCFLALAFKWFEGGARKNREKNVYDITTSYTCVNRE